jgi:septum formation protein
MTTPIILASSSATRAAMLRNAGVSFDVEAARIDEQSLKQAFLAEGSSPREVADWLAELKAVRVSARNADRLVLGADQVLASEGTILSKADGPADAARILRGLRGRTHTLISAVVACENGRPVWRHVAEARMTMRDFTESFLDAYIETEGEAITGSVGCYQIEGKGVQLFSRIEGDYFTVLGLPLVPTLAFLREREKLPL